MFNINPTQSSAVFGAASSMSCDKNLSKGDRRKWNQISDKCLELDDNVMADGNPWGWTYNKFTAKQAIALSDLCDSLAFDAYQNQVSDEEVGFRQLTYRAWLKLSDKFFYLADYGVQCNTQRRHRLTNWHLAIKTLT
jgi:hypothetical protein